MMTPTLRITRRCCLVAAGWPLAASAQAQRALDVPAFRALRFGGALRVDLVQRQPPKVLAEGDEAVIGRLQAQVEGDWLTLHHPGQRAAEQLRIVVQVWQLDEVEVSGSARLSSAELVSKRLKIQASGSSQLRLDRLTTEALSLHGGGSAVLRIAGRANEMTSELSGAAQLQAQDFEVRRVSVQLSGAAGARVWAADRLDGEIGGAAQLRYRGDPAVQVARAGAARLTRQD